MNALQQAKANFEELLKKQAILMNAADLKGNRAEYEKLYYKVEGLQMAAKLLSIDDNMILSQAHEEAFSNIKCP